MATWVGRKVLRAPGLKSDLWVDAKTETSIFCVEKLLATARLQNCNLCFLLKPFNLYLNINERR
jgi:hypothetical protein